MGDVKCDVVKILKESDIRGDKVRLQLVSWNGRTPTLEKRAFWTNEDGEEKPGKSKGLNSDDVQMIIDQGDEILKIMGKKDQ